MTAKDDIYSIASLEGKLDGLHQQVCSQGEDIKRIKEVVIEGTPGEPSLKEQVHNTSGWQRNMTKVIWYFVAAAIVQTVTIGFGFVSSAVAIGIVYIISNKQVITSVVSVIEKLPR